MENQEAEVPLQFDKDFRSLIFNFVAARCPDYDFENNQK